MNHNTFSNLPKVQDADIEGKTVLLRADLDVPIVDGKISDDLRLKTSMETIDYILSKSSKIIICGHLGRPAPNLKDKAENLKLSLEPVSKWYADKLKTRNVKLKTGGFDGWQIGEKLVLLENLRFDPGEESNDPEFAKKLADLAQAYVNDAFASSHRNHASIVGVPKLLPHFAGMRLQKEIEELSKILDKPQRPLTIIIGGAKIETKLPLVKKMDEIADFILVGGEIAKEKVSIKLAHDGGPKIRSTLQIADLTTDGKDIAEYSTQNFVAVINKSKTIVWNGPMGQFEQCFDLGSREVANAIVASGANSIVGGGNTIEFVQKEGLLNKFSFVSTGGGAMLEFLSGEELPGLTALRS